MSDSFLTSVAPLIERIDQVLEEVLSQSDDFLAHVGLYGFHGGGKRLRPVQFCLSCEALGRPTDRDVLWQSTNFELLHLATLFHDDIVDQAETRRGRPAAHKAYGIPEAVLAGDYLLARAAEVAMATKNIRCFEVFIRVIRELSLGELDQIKARNRSELDRAAYESIIYRKTAVLMEGVGLTAGLWLGAGEKETVSLGEFGRKLGLAFQMTDDVLDYRGQAARLGKPAGQDLAEGRITLPFILARELLAGTLKERLLNLGAKGELTEAEKEEIIDLVTGSGALEEAQSQAEKLAQAALADLSGFSPELKEPLVRLSRAMVIRDC